MQDAFLLCLKTPAFTGVLGQTRKGGFVAKKARVEIEKQTGESVVTDNNAKRLRGEKKTSLSNKNNKLK